MHIDPKDLAAALELILGQQQDQAEATPEDATYGLTEVADQLGITRAAVRDRILRGSLEGSKNARGEWRIPIAAAQEAFNRKLDLNQKPRGKAKASPSGLMTVKDAASYLGVSTGLLYQMTQRGDVPRVRIGNAVRIRKSDLDEMFVSA